MTATNEKSRSSTQNSRGTKARANTHQRCCHRCDSRAAHDTAKRKKKKKKKRFGGRRILDENLKARRATHDNKSVECKEATRASVIERKTRKDSLEARANVNATLLEQVVDKLALAFVAPRRAQNADDVANVLHCRQSENRKDTRKKKVGGWLCGWNVALQKVQRSFSISFELESNRTKFGQCQ